MTRRCIEVTAVVLEDDLARVDRALLPARRTRDAIERCNLWVSHRKSVAISRRWSPEGVTKSLKSGLRGAHARRDRACNQFSGDRLHGVI